MQTVTNNDFSELNRKKNCSFRRVIEKKKENKLVSKRSHSIVVFKCYADLQHDELKTVQ